MKIMRKSARLVGQTAVAAYHDPAAWIAFIGFVISGVQTAVSASGETLLSGKTMGIVMLILSIAGLIVRGIETFFIKRAQNASDDAITHDDGTAGGSQ